MNEFEGKTIGEVLDQLAEEYEQITLEEMEDKEFEARRAAVKSSRTRLAGKRPETPDSWMQSLHRYLILADKPF